MSVGEFERLLQAIATAIEARMRVAIERGAVMIQREAKRETGRCQAVVGPLPRWPRLRPPTLREKTRLGYSPRANPLLRTGEIPAAIRHGVSGLRETIEARVGVSGVVAVVQERGGGHVPARPYLERAARRKEKAVVEMVRREIRRALGIP